MNATEKQHFEKKIQTPYSCEECGEHVNNETTPLQISSNNRMGKLASSPQNSIECTEIDCRKIGQTPAPASNHLHAKHSGNTAIAPARFFLSMAGTLINAANAVTRTISGTIHFLIFKTAMLESYVESKIDAIQWISTAENYVEEKIGLIIGRIKNAPSANNVATKLDDMYVENMGKNIDSMMKNNYCVGKIDQLENDTLIREIVTKCANSMKRSLDISPYTNALISHISETFCVGGKVSEFGKHIVEKLAMINEEYAKSIE